MKTFHILNLGAGVQSTEIYLLAADGVLEDELGIKFDLAIFADPGDEPWQVYHHLRWMMREHARENWSRLTHCFYDNWTAPPIWIRTKFHDNGNPIILGDQLLVGQNSTGGRFASIPAFTKTKGSEKPSGMTRRQCTKEFKVEVIEKAIRRELLGLSAGQRIPEGIEIRQYFGFSTDEPGRAARTRGRFDAKGPQWSVGFPLIELGYTRRDCEMDLESRVPHEVISSRCVYCPFQTPAMWRQMKRDPRNWYRATQVDNGLRTTGASANRKLDQELYVHRSGKPLAEAYLEEDQTHFPFYGECEGGCGL